MARLKSEQMEKDAARMAAALNGGNRIMYTIGAAARELRLLGSDVIIGIPLAVSSKSPYFDRQ